MAVRRTGAAFAPAWTMGPFGKDAVVLVAEDDEHARSGYLEYFVRSRFMATGCASGSDALAHARAHLPDVVVTDIMLPGLDGFALAAALRADRRTRHIPIIGMTGHWTPAIQREAQRAGLGAVLLKPCSPTHLLAEVERVLRHARLLAAALGPGTEGAEPALPVGLGNAVRRRGTW
jgi:CheY-like chemotaxis protein